MGRATISVDRTRIFSRVFLYGKSEPHISTDADLPVSRIVCLVPHIRLIS